MTPLAVHAHFDDLAWWGWALVGAAIVVGAVSLWLAVRWTLRPGETGLDHVKRSILDDDAGSAAPR
jgi:hypothetical protein